MAEVSACTLHVEVESFGFELPRFQFELCGVHRASFPDGGALDRGLRGFPAIDELLVAQDSLLLESDDLDRGDFDQCNDLPLGIANLRGDIVSMLDLEGFFSGKAGKSSHEQRMLALRPAGDEVRTALLVDIVDGLQAFEDARIARVTRGYDAEVAPYARAL